MCQKKDLELIAANPGMLQKNMPNRASIMPLLKKGCITREVFGKTFTLKATGVPCESITPA